MAPGFEGIRGDLPDGISLTVIGPLDAFTAPGLDQAIGDALGAVPGGGSVAIDLRRLEFIAAAGVRALFRAADAADRAGVANRVVVAAGQHARTIIDRIDVDGRLPLVERLYQVTDAGERRP
ncbi:STAS domain-containing protein [Dactylosporangium sp. CA-092794]|uniref:STAS domain-containing protein n=1 Tax=Dactylosporangium sp. CA-092794 TaxID=3239929 RepID=UPI003D90A95A